MHLKYIINADLYRVYGKKSFNSFLKAYLLIPGFKYLFWFRISSYLYFLKGFQKVFIYPIYLFSRLILRHYSYKYGMDIPCGTQISPGFYIGHFSGIVVSSKSKIGKNCNISHGVTIGFSSRGNRKGYPEIGEEVYIGPGAKVIGNIKIGNNVAIGANAVVLNDVPDNAVVVGIPAKVVSMNNSDGYILNKV